MSYVKLQACPPINISSPTTLSSFLQVTGTMASADGAVHTGATLTPAFTPTVSLNTMSGLYSNPSFTPGGGVVVTNAMGLYVGSGSQAGAGTVLNGYGIYVAAPAFATSTQYAGWFDARVTVNGHLRTQGGFSVNRTTLSGSQTYQALITDYIIAVTDANATVTVNLPLASAVSPGQFYTIKDEGAAAGAHTLTIAGTGGATIDGDATLGLVVNYSCLTIYSSGTNWYIVARK